MTESIIAKILSGIPPWPVHHAHRKGSMHCRLQHLAAAPYWPRQHLLPALALPAVIASAPAAAAAGTRSRPILRLSTATRSRGQRLRRPKRQPTPSSPPSCVRARDMRPRPCGRFSSARLRCGPGRRAPRPPGRRKTERLHIGRHGRPPSSLALDLADATCQSSRPHGVPTQPT
jgi:hypothetical protein